MILMMIHAFTIYCTSKIDCYFTQVTRSIGDDDLKPAVTAEPEITENTLHAEDEFLVRSFMLHAIICMKFVICIESLNKLQFQVLRKIS